MSRRLVRCERRQKTHGQTLLPLGRRFATPLTGRCRGRFPFVVNGLILKLFEIVRMRDQKRMSLSNASHVFDEIVFSSGNADHTRRGRNVDFTFMHITFLKKKSTLRPRLVWSPLTELNTI